LPMVVTEGDHFADLVEKHGLGITVPAADTPALVDALEKALFDTEFRSSATQALAVVRESYRWSEVLKPLVSHVEGLAGGTISAKASRIRYSPARKRAPRFSVHDISRGFSRLFRGEFRSLLRAVRRKLFRKG